MQMKNEANNNHKQFYVLLNTNQIKVYTYPDMLKENPQPTLLMRLFTTHIHHFLIRVRAKLFVVMIFFNLFSFC